LGYIPWRLLPVNKLLGAGRLFPFLHLTMGPYSSKVGIERLRSD
jgi:hypothetical protein